MPERHVPVRPDLEQLRHQAKDLLKAIRRGDLRERGASDLQFAFDRGCLQGQLDTARQLHAMGARPAPDSLMGPCETQSADGLAFLLDLGAPLDDGQGNRLAPVGMVLETYGRNPAGKHACLALFEQQGVVYPDTAPVSVHRGRLDLLQALVRRDSSLLQRGSCGSFRGRHPNQPLDGGRGSVADRAGQSAGVDDAAAGDADADRRAFPPFAATRFRAIVRASTR